MRGTPEVAARLKEYPPYAFIQFTEKNKKPRYVFSSPARRTIFVGDEAAMKRYSAYLTAQQQSEQIRRLQAQQRAANFRQALAYGLAAGAMQQPVYQQPIYQPPPIAPMQSFQTSGLAPLSPQRSLVYPTLPNSGIRDYSRGAVGIVEGGKVYPTLPHSNLRDYSRGAIGIVE